MTVRTVAMLTAGGIAPCLSSAVGGLIERWTEVAPDVRLIAYLDGYAGLLAGRSVEVTPEVRRDAHLLHGYGGSPIGNSRVKLTNTADLVKRGLVPEGADPLAVASDQLVEDGVDVLHTIGGDDTNTTAADLAAHLAETGRELTVVGLPKTIDNDVQPIAQTLGAWTAAEEAARYARNIVAEHSSNPRMLVVHEIMGRHCGWLAAATARNHHDWYAAQDFLHGFGNDPRCWDVHAVYLPELALDIEAETTRLRALMDEIGSVTIFLSEGAGAHEVVTALEAAGEKVPVDPFGHVQLDKVKPGEWFGKQFAEAIGAEKVMVQKSGYFSRSAPANAADLALIRDCVVVAVDSALARTPGVVGGDVERGGELRTIEFERIAGGGSFDTSTPWFGELLDAIGQPRPTG